MIKRLAREFLSTLDSLNTNRASFADFVILDSSKLIQKISFHAVDRELSFFGADADLLQRAVASDDARFDIPDGVRRRATIERHQFVPAIAALAQSAFDTFIAETYKFDGAVYDVRLRNADEGDVSRFLDNLKEALEWIRSEQAEPGFREVKVYRNKNGKIVDNAKIVYKTVGFGKFLPPAKNLLQMGRRFLDTRLTIRAVQALERIRFRA